MAPSRVEPFANNWAYLKTELNWLDQLLMVAIARQRKETYAINRVAQSHADRVTSHWWKGLIAFEHPPASDSPARSGSLQHLNQQEEAPQTSLELPQPYQERLESRIQRSEHQGIWLGLPMLCRHLQLTPFEKKLVLMCLAVEVNHRYARIYSYLQSSDGKSLTRSGVPVSDRSFGMDNQAADLPTVDLVLRLLCRNDTEWQVARRQLTPEHSLLIQHQLLERLQGDTATFLRSSLRLSESLVNYLLAESPQPELLDGLTKTCLNPLSGSWQIWQPQSITHDLAPVGEDSIQLTIQQLAETGLVLPQTLMQRLAYLCHRVQMADGMQSAQSTPRLIVSQHPGTIVIVAGAAGTGKTMAAKAIAQTCYHALCILDLRLIEPLHFASTLVALLQAAPKLLLIQAAHLWFGRSTPIAEAQLQSFWQHRQMQPGLTFLSVQLGPKMSLQWQRQCDEYLDFPLPEAKARQQLWQKALNQDSSLRTEVDCTQLAQMWRLSGGKIDAIAQTAFCYAMAESSPILTMNHLQQAWRVHRHH
jgi:hypothetical protein